MDVSDLLRFIETRRIQFVHLRFTDTHGREHQISIPSSALDASLFIEGKMFDGSSLMGWKSIHDSDMLLKPDLATAVLDPFSSQPSMMIRCDILDPRSKTLYPRAPRSIALYAEQYLQQTGIADRSYWGPEPEFFIFDDVRWNTSINHCSFSIKSSEASWSTDEEVDQKKHHGYAIPLKGGYCVTPPSDSALDLRGQMSQHLQDMGIVVEAHHHEVATANQNEICTRYNTLTRKADEIQLLKYVVKNVARRNGKTATFMPKPLVGDNGSGMHCHQSLFKNDDNLFSGSGYSGLSEKALFYIGGIIHHAHALNAIVNPSSNSYRRLIPGFEAPVMLAYSAHNRSAAIRIPACLHHQSKRIEVRFPDATSNPYLAFAAMLMAGLDGIQKHIHPGEALERDLYELSRQEKAEIPQVAPSFEEALSALDRDRQFLKHGDVFSDDWIDSYLELKEREAHRIRMATHPLEMELYYDA